MLEARRPDFFFPLKYIKCVLLIYKVPFICQKKKKKGCTSYLTVSYNLKDNFILPHDVTVNEEEKKAHDGYLI